MTKSILHLSASSSYGGGPIFISNLCKFSKNNSYYYGPKGPIFFRISKYASIISETFKFGLNFELIKKIISLKINNIHLHGRGSIIYNIFNIIIIKVIKKKINIVFTPHGVNIKFSFLDNFINIINYFIIDKIIFVSDDEYFLYKKKFVILNKHKIIYNGTYIEKKTEKKISRKNNIIVSFTKFNDQKNPYEICHIAEKLQKFKFHVFASGPNKKKFVNYCNEKNLKNIIIKKFTNFPRDEISKAFCYLSTSKWEGLPLSILEALELKKTLCLTKVVGHMQFLNLKYDAIKYYELGDINQAVKNILSLYKNYYSILKKLNLKKFYSTYDIKNTIKEYDKVYL